MWKWPIGVAGAVIVVLAMVFDAFYEPDIPRAVLEAKYASLPSQFVVLADGARAHYRDRGPRAAPVLLLLHGSNSSLFDWEAWSRLLSSPTQDQSATPTAIGFQGEMAVQQKPSKSVDATGLDLKGGSYVLFEVTPKQKGADLHKLLAEAIARVRAQIEGLRVISVDLPGHSLTGAVPNGDYSEAGMTEFVKAFADKLRLTQFAIAGNSMGGGVAARFAERYPDRVSALVLVDAHAEGMAPLGDRIPMAFKLARLPVVGNLLLYLTPRSLVAEGLDDAVAREEVVTPAVIDRYWDFARMEGTRRATLDRFRLKPDTYVRDHLGAIKAPTLILWGAEDHVLPVADAKAWAKGIPGAKLVVYPATGHLPMEEVPEKSAADVRSFISGTH